MYIMTVVTFYSWTFQLFCLSYKSMEKSLINSSESSSPTSDLSNNGRLKDYSILQRHNSFSSSSNDSSISDNSIHTRHKSSKHSFVEEPFRAYKRSRNSSGSSVSSNVSGISDKDLKSTEILSQTDAEVKNCNKNNQKSPFSNYSKINSRRIEFEEKSVTDNFDTSESPLVTVPGQHNLRGTITKKGCTCCPSTCAAVVFRGSYKRYVKTGEEKTVISSTKVRTYIKETSPPNISNITENDCSNNNTSANNNIIPYNQSRSRKRKSEAEKLYESLHEIEWAKNFSPDNILPQINVRQAAACSVLGYAQTDSIYSPKQNSKKLAIMDAFDDVDSSLIKSINSENIESSSCEVISNMNKETCIVSNYDNEEAVTDLHTAQITTSVNISSCSMPHLNVKEISINTRETVHPGSLIMENTIDSNDDPQLCYTSDESSSEISSSIVSLQSKHSFDFSYADIKNYNLSDVHIPEYSATATFFDITEEGIRTIDACFREVGAEVVVSTCYEEEDSLPSLTSMQENKISNKMLSDSPPVLEPSIDVSFSYNKSSTQKCGKQIKKKKVKCCSKNFEIKNKINVVNRINSHFSQTVLLRKHLRNICTFSKLHYNKLKTARKVVKKYLKFLLNKSRLKHLFKNRFNSTHNKHVNGLDVLFKSKNISKLNKNNGTTLMQNQVLSSSDSESHISYKLVDTKSDKITYQTRNKKYSCNKITDEIMHDYVKHNSCTYNRKKICYPTEIEKKGFVSENQNNSIHSRSAVALSATTDFKNYKFDDPFPSMILLPSQYGFTLDYKSIRVKRHQEYTHIILMITRRKSTFLTLEALKDITDVLKRSDNDSSCPLLIINGIGESFCSGLDVTSLIGPQRNIACTELAVAVKEFIQALSSFKKPLAAVVNGPALGLGVTLLNHADLVIASEKATFCMPYSSLGYMPEGGATLTLPQVVGSTVAMDLFITGKTLTAREACNIGLISEVHKSMLLPAELASRVRTLTEKPLSALETTKALLKMQLHVNLQLVLENEINLLPRMWLTQTCQDLLRKALYTGILSG